MIKDSFLKKESVWKLIAKLTIPTVIITLVMVIYNMADIFFIGKTNNTDMVNAISICMPLFTIIQAFGTLIGSGGSTAISIYLGKNENLNTKKISSFCCYFSIILGFLLAIFLNIFANQTVNLLGSSEECKNYAITYLRIISLCSPILLFSNSFVNIIRADGSAKESMIANLLGTFTNIILDPIFILVFNQGVAGAAIATVIGNLITAIYIIFFIKKNDNTYSLSKKDLSLKKEYTLNTIKLGFPLACGTLAMSFSYMVMNNILVKYNADATGAFGICRTIMLLSNMIHMGICMGIQPAISYNYGDNNLKRVKEIVIKTGIVTVIFGIIIASVVILFRNNILKLFINDSNILYYADKLIIGCLASAPLYGIFQLSSVFLQSTEKSFSSTLLTLLRQGIILIPVMILLNSLYGFTGILFVFLVTDIIATILGIILSIYRYNKLKSKIA